MSQFKVKRIEDLNNINLNHLVLESKADGFRFLERLLNEFKDGSNKFSDFGEVLYGVFNHKDDLLAIGGLNIDPYSKDEKVGRLRRFYVKKEYRNKGLGKLLLDNIIDYAKTYFDILVLYTDTKPADKFYSSYGFKKNNNYPKSSHFVKL
ncbi:GNAT family N-acetyltransferase [Bacillus sp. 03113]|uniref:GNAT family N-acetyltransferase n=1 Tax=Bacillus sp. 03113 TaxID=2578211 RepID=UPI001143553F|nr:GNAT family N-acetyltransferase [Bacillus sp. 03113]